MNQQITKPDFFIGIDPDVKASGLAMWDKTKFVTLQCYDLTDLLNSLLNWHTNARIKVKLEAGWKAKGLNWHKKGGLGAANAVGRNHEIGRQIEAFCKKHNIPYDLILPQGYSSWDHKRFCTYTGWPKHIKTNPETRVAGMLVYGY